MRMQKIRQPGLESGQMQAADPAHENREPVVVGRVQGPELAPAVMSSAWHCTVMSLTQTMVQPEERQALLQCKADAQARYQKYLEQRAQRAENMNSRARRGSRPKP